MKFHNLTLKDKELFNKFLSLSRHDLSVYAFENIFIWKALFEIKWVLLDNNLCIFFQDKIGTFAYLPPLGNKQNLVLVNEVFEVMDRFNENKEISRIENIEEREVTFYKDLGLNCRIKSHDYLCLKSDLVNLRGNKFKSKRSSFNFFLKNYQSQYLLFSRAYIDGCLGLFELWIKQRKIKIKDSVYQWMLEDSYSCFKALLNDYKDLNIIGRLVQVKNEVKGFTFGFKLNPDTFCVLYEITDHSIKGLAQFIFQKFCSELKDSKFINIMDDSGLQNLKRVKLSYNPIKLIPSYIAKRKNA